MRPHWQRVACWKGFTGTPAQTYLTIQMQGLLSASFPMPAGLTSFTTSHGHSGFPSSSLHTHAVQLSRSPA